MPEEEKHTLLENIEIEAEEEEKKPWMRSDLVSSFLFSICSYLFFSLGYCVTFSAWLDFVASFYSEEWTTRFCFPLKVPFKHISHGTGGALNLTNWLNLVCRFIASPCESRKLSHMIRMEKKISGTDSSFLLDWW